MRNTDVNTIVMSGRLVKDAEQKALNFATFTIAVNRSYKTKSGEVKDEASFIDCELNGRDKLVPYLKKGVKISLNGELRQNRWEKDGKKYSSLVVRVDNNSIKFINESNRKHDENAVEVSPKAESETMPVDEETVIPF